MTDLSSRLYSVDTSALIDGLERYYPEENFPGLWDQVEVLVSGGRFFCSEEVWEEARVHAAPVKAWCEKVGSAALVKPTDLIVVREVQQILQEYPLLVKNQKNKNRADPFVIAVAKITGATVVTGEGSDGTENRPKIPYICKLMGIPCVRFLDVVRLEGWKFR
ncbi:DUF4411 family protein [Microbispora sp. SCL1-1]|uniref:DUF4411 family protein n=1 Tax=Microbispora TaxID=2005 RepID=UPI00115BC96D|nr:MULTISPECIES: DUF4411 family protein [unclassified Microbispora]NJP30259.1 DUF4411 family protein [Microbispora sp. CL1-1]TQS02238.1 DUF4411 family protein [Microbispora sp. SCL1-1]